LDLALDHTLLYANHELSIFTFFSGPKYHQSSLKLLVGIGWPISYFLPFKVLFSATPKIKKIEVYMKKKKKNKGGSHTKNFPRIFLIKIWKDWDFFGVFWRFSPLSHPVLIKLCSTRYVVPTTIG
jgi:hypothetical protein